LSDLGRLLSDDEMETVVVMSDRIVACPGEPAGTSVGRRHGLDGVDDVAVLVSLTFVFKTSGCRRRSLLRGFHPRLAMARLFDATLAKEDFHATLQTGMTSDGWTFKGIPIEIRNWQSFLFSRVVAIFQLPFCSAESPTSQ
jgi:hypothetical protein